ncbi:MAG: DUF1553 domain-containing protein, partial [Planctomycetaceae bacterium]|nr:DUF1553 domain-containing protein [Planctomycetaceae bacterium]
DQGEVMRGRLRMQVGMYLRELAKGTPEQDLSAAFLSYRTDDLRPLVLNRWREYLAGLSDDDPVFGPWLQLLQLNGDEFPARAGELLAAMVEQNGDLSKLAAPQSLNGAVPRWNPRVLEALQAKQPQSLLDVADAYGDVFIAVQREWMQGLTQSAEEAVSPDAVVPDEDARHASINSAVSRQLRRHLYQSGTPTAMDDALASTLLNRPVRDRTSGMGGAIEALHLNDAGSPPRAMALEEESTDQVFQVFRRGSSIDRGEEVHPRFLTVLSDKREQAFLPGQRRLGLARSITDPANPLTRRVVVNWVWQHHFGQGLVRTPDDYGTRGQSPTHPELLDY